MQGGIKMSNMNGHGPPTGQVYVNGGGGVGHIGEGFINKGLSESKLSLNSVATSNGSTLGSGKDGMGNGYTSSMQSLGEYEDKVVTLLMEAKDRRFGFSVYGGIDQDGAPQIDNISPDSPASRVNLLVRDEILEVNGTAIHHMTHTEIIMQIHKCKNSITLKIRRRYDSSAPNGDVHEMAIDVPSYHSNKPPSPPEPYTNQNATQPHVNGMLKYAATRNSQPKTTVPVQPTQSNRESNVPNKYDNAAYRESNVPAKFVNDGFVDDGGGGYVTVSPSRRIEPYMDTNGLPDQPRTLGLAQFNNLLDVMSKKINYEDSNDDIALLRNLFASSHFRAAVKTHNQLTKIQGMRKNLEIFKPIGTNSQLLLSEVSYEMMTRTTDPAAVELLELFNKPHIKELLGAHDKIARREAMGQWENGSITGSEAPSEGGSSVPGEWAEEMEEEVPCKIVRIDKTNMHLGATVRNEGDQVIISRIIKGGAAEKSGVLNEGDEILEINNEPVRGKNVNEVVDLLRELEGTLTFVLIPCTQPPKEPNDETVVMKALFDYDPTNDDMLPCEELGLNFRKGDVLEILDQNDPDWWQARLLDNENNTLPGLIPSKTYQKVRERKKITLKNEDKEPIVKEKKQCFCGRTRRKGKKETKRSKRNAPIEDNEPLTYEDMVKRYPDPSRKRPIVLIGAPQVGRRELKERLIRQFPDRYASPVAHTTRSQNDEELSGVDYIFYSRAQFEKAIAAGDFIEQGTHDGHYYGTSFQAVRDVINNGKTCILNIHCAALMALKSSFLLPYVLFITLPAIDRVKQLRSLDTTMEPFNPKVRLSENEIDDIIEQARDMSRSHGHYFDKVIVNHDFDRTYDKLVQICTSLERDPQWVPASWLPGG